MHDSAVYFDVTKTLKTNGTAMSRVWRGKNCATISGYVHLCFEKYIVHYFIVMKLMSRKTMLNVTAICFHSPSTNIFRGFFAFVTFKRNVFRYNC